MQQNEYGGASSPESGDETADRPLSRSQREIYLAWLCEEGVDIQNELTAGRLSDAEAYRRVFDLLSCAIQFIGEDLGDFGLKH